MEAGLTLFWVLENLKVRALVVDWWISYMWPHYTYPVFLVVPVSIWPSVALRLAGIVYQYMLVGDTWIWWRSNGGAAITRWRSITSTTTSSSISRL